MYLIDLINDLATVSQNNSQLHDKTKSPSESIQDRGFSNFLFQTEKLTNPPTACISPIQTKLTPLPYPR